MNEEARDYETVSSDANVVEEEVASPYMTLEDFLAAHPIDENVTTDITISERLKDYKFTIELFSEKQHESYLNASIIKNRSGKILKQNLRLFNELVAINHCRYPNFKNIDFLKKLGVNTSREALYKVLKVGEVDALVAKIIEFNGYDEDYTKLADEAKN